MNDIQSTHLGKSTNVNLFHVNFEQCISVIHVIHVLPMSKASAGTAATECACALSCFNGTVGGSLTRTAQSWTI